MQIMSHDQMNDNYLFIGKTDILVGHHVALPLTQGAPEWFKTMIDKLNLVTINKYKPFRHLNNYFYPQSIF